MNMKIISHRGNLNGKNKDRENHPDYIDETLNYFDNNQLKYFDVEVDLWYSNDKFYLGHDEPLYEISKKWLMDRSPRLWVHVKNIEAMKYLSTINSLFLNYFWHQNDSVTMTRDGYIWCYPNIYMKNGITVELGPKTQIPEVYGICTDHPLSWIE
jgi:hypothetical protein